MHCFTITNPEFELRLKLRFERVCGPWNRGLSGLTSTDSGPRNRLLAIPSDCLLFIHGR
jgi:hypothetical protein